MKIIHKHNSSNTYNSIQLNNSITPCFNIKTYNQNLKKEMIALTKRLYIQIYRRPSTLMAGIVQPLLWIILFSALFQNAPIIFFNKNIKYTEFLSPGIIIFTAFTGSMNSGLPIIFDREFGFLNRLLVSPLSNKASIMLSCLISIWTTTICQIIIIITCSIIFLNNTTILNYLHNIITISTLIIVNIASISICLAFLLPGHIEFLAFLLITNLPILFSSTALAPLSFMPYWLQIIACINPLTYAIEILRYISYNATIYQNNHVIETIWINLNLNASIFILAIINIINFFIVHYCIKYKYK